RVHHVSRPVRGLPRKVRVCPFETRPNSSHRNPLQDQVENMVEAIVGLRRYAPLFVLFLLTSCGLPAPSGVPAPGGVHDLLIVGGRIIDGTGSPWFRGDVAITGDRIAAVGLLAGAQARDTIDARGLIVAPGFIDMLGHSENT